MFGGEGHTPDALPSRNTRYPFYRNLGGLTSRSERVRKISPLSGFDHRAVQQVASRYTDGAVPTPIQLIHLSFLVCECFQNNYKL